MVTLLVGHHSQGYSSVGETAGEAISPPDGSGEAGRISRLLNCSISSQAFRSDCGGRVILLRLT